MENLEWSALVAPLVEHCQGSNPGRNGHESTLCDDLETGSMFYPRVNAVARKDLG